MKMHALRATALATVLALGGLTVAQPAEAGGRHHGHGGNGGALALGLITGAVVGSALVGRSRTYVDREPVYEYVEQERVYDDYALEPWSPEWYESCSARYRSFDPDSGTFQPYEGPRQFCR